MSNSELLTSSYDFTLPDELIATHPASPRDSAKLLVYNRETDTITHAHFYDFEKFIPSNVALIFNDTKVIKARLFGKKSSGGKLELLINRALNAHDINVYIRGKVKVDTEIFFDENLIAKVKELNEDGSRVVNFYLQNHSSSSQAPAWELEAPAWEREEKLRFEELLPII